MDDPAVPQEGFKRQCADGGRAVLVMQGRVGVRADVR